MKREINLEEGNMQRISIVIDQETLARLQEMMVEEDRSRSNMARKLINEGWNHRHPNDDSTAN